MSEATGSKPEKRSKQKCRKFKEYWDQELSAKWIEKHECERLFKLSRKRGRIRARDTEKLNFKRAQKEFDQLLRIKKRQYCKGKLLVIDKCVTTDPNSFWEHIRKLGPKKNQEIPWEVTVDGKLETNQNVVMKVWRDEFEKLYNVVDGEFSDSF